MKEIMEAVFGVYTPLTYTDVVSGTNLIKPVSGLAGVDWPYVGGVLLFAICLYSFFRILGVILK